MGREGAKGTEISKGGGGFHLNVGQIFYLDIHMYNRMMQRKINLIIKTVCEQ